MSLETKGTIKYDPDVKPSEPQFMIEAKQLGICVEGGGDIDQMVDELTTRIRREISSEFGIPRCDVELVKYSMTCTFDVSAPVNHTLEEFGTEPLTTADQAALAKKIKDYAARTGQDPLDVLDDLKKEKDRQQQTIMDKAADMVNAGALDSPGCTVRATTHKATREGKGVDK